MPVDTNLSTNHIKVAAEQLEYPHRESPAKAGRHISRLAQGLRALVSGPLPNLFFSPSPSTSGTMEPVHRPLPFSGLEYRHLFSCTRGFVGPSAFY